MPALPPPEKLKEAEATIRDVFKDEFKKTAPADQLALAAKLLEQGAATKDDPAVRYQLLVMAAELAGRNGGVAQALKACDVLKAEYPGEVSKLKAKALADAERAARTKEQFLELANAQAALTEEAVREEDFNAALSACASAQRAARAAQDMALFTATGKRVQELNGLKLAYERIRMAKAKLFENPDDAGANMTLGRYYGPERGDWTKGLPLLAKCGDEKWSKAARADWADPQETAAQVAAGDQWWELAGGLAKVEQEGVKLRAGYWYRKALSQASGLTKVKLEKRMEQLPAAPAAAPGGGTAAAIGVSEETRKALPTEEELAQAETIGKGYKNGEKTKYSEFYALKRKVSARLKEKPEAWSDADFQARLQGETQLCSVYNKASGMTLSSTYQSVWEVWPTFAAAASSSEQFAERMKAVPGQMKQFYEGCGYSGTSTSLEEKPRHALHAYITKNSALYGSNAAKAQFCDWLKGKGVASKLIDEYKSDLK